MTTPYSNTGCVGQEIKVLIIRASSIIILFKISKIIAYETNNYVCTWEDGRPVAPDYVSKAFSRLVRDMNLPIIRFHDLRHTHATMRGYQS